MASTPHDEYAARMQAVGTSRGEPVGVGNRYVGAIVRAGVPLDLTPFR